MILNKIISVSNNWNLLTKSKYVFNIKLDSDICLIESLELNSNTWNHLTVFKRMNWNSFKNEGIDKLFPKIIYMSSAVIDLFYLKFWRR